MKNFACDVMSLYSSDARLDKLAQFSELVLWVSKATITRCDLSATIIFKLVDSYIIAFKFAQ